MPNARRRQRERVRAARRIESGSDADFRAANARTAEAQAAPPNLYEQCYLETGGRAGDLRISRVTAGDPVIVGSLFIHERI